MYEEEESKFRTCLAIQEGHLLLGWEDYESTNNMVATVIDVMNGDFGLDDDCR